MAKFKKKKPHHRNASGGKKLFKAPTGWLGSSAAAIIGGGGGALVGGVLANQEIVKPETTGLLMTVGGLIGGVFAEGHTRTAMHSLTGAGSGQLALAYMANRATASADPKRTPKTETPQVATPTTPALSAPAPNGQAGPVTMPSNAQSGGSVWSVFRDAAGELEWLDDGDEYGDGDGGEDDDQ
jgi:hypothetical protein